MNLMDKGKSIRPGAIQILMMGCLLIVTFSLAYYFVFYLPGIKNKERQDNIEKEKLETQADTAKKKSVSFCQAEASENAKSLLKTKAELEPTLKEAANKDLYLKSDYDTYYEQCLQQQGIFQ